MKYDFQNMLTIKGDQLSGAMSPFLVAQEFCKITKSKMSGLTRVCFDSYSEVHQVYEDGFKRGLTGHDTLIISTPNNGSLAAFQMLIDMGSQFIPVAIYFVDDGELKISSIYTKYPFEKKLTEDELKEIFSTLKTLPDKFIPKKSDDDLLDSANQKHTTQ